MQIHQGEDIHLCPLTSDKEYIIVNKKTQKLLTIQGGSTSNSAAVVQYENKNYAYQKWTLEALKDNGGDLIVCVVGIVAQAAGLFLIAFCPSTLTVVICAVCAALGFGTLNSACTTIVTRNVTEQRRSYAVSTFFIFCDATMGFGPALLGIFASNGYAPVYYISSLITLLALPICLYALRK